MATRHASRALPRTLRSSRASACGWSRAFRCADLRGTGVAQGQWPQREGQRCGRARAISRATRGAHSAILAQRHRLVVSKGLARYLHWQTQRVVRGARAIRGVQQRDGSKVPFLRAIWRVARREWRCAADAPHLTWCAAARPRIGCSAPPCIASTLEVLVVARSSQTMRFCGETYHLISADDLVGNHGARRTRLWCLHPLEQQ